MAEVVFAVTVNADLQNLSTIVPQDSVGGVATVDPSGFTKETNEPGGSDVVIDPRDPAGNLNIIVKPGTSLGTSEVKGFIDVDTTEGVKRLDITFAITTIAAEAVGATLTSRGTEPVGAEG